MHFAMIARHGHRNGSADRRQRREMMQRCRWYHGVAVFLLGLLVAGGVVWSAQPDARKPNILIIWGDDIGWYNPCAPQKHFGTSADHHAVQSSTCKPGT